MICKVCALSYVIFLYLCALLHRDKIEMAGLFVAMSGVRRYLRGVGGYGLVYATKWSLVGQGIGTATDSGLPPQCRTNDISFPSAQTEV